MQSSTISNIMDQPICMDMEEILIIKGKKEVKYLQKILQNKSKIIHLTGQLVVPTHEKIAIHQTFSLSNLEEEYLN